MRRLTSIRFVQIGILWGCLTPIVTTAQVIPDATLPINSTVSPQGNTLLLNGGTKVGENLFHSFEQFSISASQIAHFNNSLTIKNILSRVTGDKSSYINGLIQANGSANLFFFESQWHYFWTKCRIRSGWLFFG